MTTTELVADMEARPYPGIDWRYAWVEQEAGGGPYPLTLIHRLFGAIPIEVSSGSSNMFEQVTEPDYAERQLTVAVVGIRGAGKSVVADLICRSQSEWWRELGVDKRVLELTTPGGSLFDRLAAVMEKPDSVYNSITLIDEEQTLVVGDRRAESMIQGGALLKMGRKLAVDMVYVSQAVEFPLDGVVHREGGAPVLDRELDLLVLVEPYVDRGPVRSVRLGVWDPYGQFGGTDRYRPPKTVKMEDADWRLRVRGIRFEKREVGDVV